MRQKELPPGKRHTITSAESQWYIDTGELPDVGTEPDIDEASDEELRAHVENLRLHGVRT